MVHLRSYIFFGSAFKHLEEQKTDTRMNNEKINGTNMHDLGVIKLVGAN